MNKLSGQAKISLEKRGFDRCYPIRGGYWGVGCSRCEAAVINGVACHEHGCPNQRKAAQDVADSDRG